MESSLSIRKPFLSSGYECRYEAKIRIPEFSFSHAADLVLRKLLPSEVLRNEPLTDLKGWDAAHLGSEQLGSLQSVDGDELLAISGSIFKGRCSNEEDTLETEPFRLSLFTSFLDFAGPSHIRHTVQKKQAGSLPDWMPLLLLGRAFPLELNSLRLSIEFFKAQFTSALFGSSPTATQSLLLECNKDEIRVLINAENLKRKKNLPLEQNQFLQRLNHTIQEICEVDLIKDYQSQRER